jgi:hypothetical protein
VITASVARVPNSKNTIYLSVRRLWMVTGGFSTLSGVPRNRA